MLIESVNTTTKRVEDLLEKMNDDSSPICVEDHFTGNQLLNAAVSKNNAVSLSAHLFILL